MGGLAALVVVALALTGFLLLRPPGPAPITTRDVEATVKKSLDEQARTQAAAPANASVAYNAIQPSLVVISTTASTAKGQSSGSGAGRRPTGRRSRGDAQPDAGALPRHQGRHQLIRAEGDR